ncbi:MAG: SAM-dependent methyltransferase, partial [Clostridiaceae bacterium]|nr:SAM-dependent methyltransferase [Clostridiaceae bacterium]
MWIFSNSMGPNPIWLTEYLVQPFDLKPGMRVLDLGCGKGITSVFLAREFGVQVYA